MSRSFFRVVVVAVVALSVILSLAPVAQARPQGSTRPAIEAASHGGWLESALSWLTRFLAAANPAPWAPHGGVKPNGSCVDPQGHERPCP
jgi:hypothetical protein